MHKIVITGGAGFIGSHVTEKLYASYPESEIVIFDKMTYAADYENVAHMFERHRVRLVVGDVCDLAACRDILKDCDLLVHLAAESHVDNSFGDSLSFTRTNTLGTHALIEAARVAEVPKIIHISTDEVYGEMVTGEADENARLIPTNPYSASKAAADMIVTSYVKSFALPVVIVRSNNIFGIRQYPEKLIPRCCLSLIRGEKIPIHGNGAHTRHFLAAEDFANAIDLLISKGKIGEVYNIGTHDEYTNLEVVSMICTEFGVAPDDVIEFVADRPFNDQRYNITTDKLAKLGWKPTRFLKDEVGKLRAWYEENVYRYKNF